MLNFDFRVEYDPEKWISEPHMTISGGIMFDRQTGLSVKECLQKCTRPEFQVIYEKIFGCRILKF
jgi:hypothetical protein